LMENNLTNLCKLLRYFVLTSTTKAGSGHPTTCLSSIELLSTLFFGGFYKFDLQNPDNPNNDRLIFSKGHAAPLFYSLYAAAGVLNYEELLTLRKFKSRLEGHPTMDFEYTEAATGSLGQGLSIGLGMALSGVPHVFVLLGDGEMAEGNIWEAMELSSYYKTANLIGILDVNRLGQSGETLVGWNIGSYAEKISSFGWETFLVNDGHNLSQIKKAYKLAINSNPKPKMIIAKTVKGKGVSHLENKEGWHGKVLSEEKLREAIKKLGNVDLKLRGKIKKGDWVNG